MKTIFYSSLSLTRQVLTLEYLCLMTLKIIDSIILHISPSGS